MRILLVVLALTSLVRADAPPLPSASGDPLVCTSPQALEQVCPCLVKQADLGDECKLVGPEEVRGVRLVRAGGGQNTAVYVVVQSADGWHVVHQLAWEQHHGKAESSMHPSAQSELKLGAARVYRVDFTYANDQDDASQKETHVVLCPIDGAGKPRCTVDVKTKCDERSGKHKKTGRGALAISNDGTATLTPTGAAGCLTGLGAHRIW